MREPAVWMSAGLVGAFLATGVLAPGAIAAGARSRPSPPISRTLADPSAALPAAQSAPHDDAAVFHALSRLTFGPRPEDIARVRQIGLSQWIDEQLGPARSPDDAAEARLAGFNTLALTSADIAREYVLPARAARRQRQLAAPDNRDMSAARAAQSPMTRDATLDGERLVIEELASAKLLRAVYGERQLEEVLVDFWFNHFNVFAAKGRTPIYLTTYERDAIRPHVLGRFRDLLGATAKSPAMLFYLDNWMSVGAQGATDTPARQRPGRTTSGRTGQSGGRTEVPRPVRGLNENYGRELLELHTLGVDGGYTQKDVTEVARAFTGWTIDQRSHTFTFVSRVHDTGRKVVLGREFEPGGGIEDGERVLDRLADHPATAHHIARKLTQRFVSDNPPEPLVERAAQRFRATNGNLREVVRTIITSPEFFAMDVRRTKIKSPFEFLTSALRVSHAEITNARPLVRALRELGMPLYMCQPPSGYSETGDAWVSSGALVVRMNIALDLAHSRARGIQTPLASEPDLASLRTTLIRNALGGTISSSTEATIQRGSSAPLTIALTLGSPEFQRR